MDAARTYIGTGPAAMYERHGIGLLLVAMKDSGTPIGICGLIKRETLDDVDIGFAFLPEHWGKGFGAKPRPRRSITGSTHAGFGGS